MNNEWSVSFLQNSPFDIYHTYSSDFFIGQSSSETSLLIRFEAAPSVFSVLHALKSLWRIFCLRNKKKSYLHNSVSQRSYRYCYMDALEKKLDGHYTRMLRAILNKSWRQHPTGHQLYGHLPPITKTIQIRRTRHAGHCWRSKDELISDVLLWTPAYG